jgi:hypothetical protein
VNQVNGITHTAYSHNPFIANKFIDIDAFKRSVEEEKQG